MVQRAGTTAERTLAADALTGSLWPKTDNSLQTVERTGHTTVTAEGVVTLTRNGVNTHLKQSCITHFLNSLTENAVFTYHDFIKKDVFGMGDFATIKTWLSTLGLIEKAPGGWIVRSIKAIVTVWNALVLDKMVMHVH